MTYPPQQPGPYGQQDPWGRPQGPFPPQPPSQAPPWLTNGPGGFPSFEPDPKKPRTGLIVTLIIVGVLVLGGGGFGVWMLLSKDDPSPGGGGGGGDDGPDARTVAEQYVSELEKTVNTPIEEIDLAPMESVTCGDDFERMDREIGDAQAAAREGSDAPEPPGTIEVGMTDFQSTADSGSFTLTQTVDGSDGPDTKMTMAMEDGDWRVCGLYGSAAPQEPSAAEPTGSEPSAEEPSGDRPVPNPIPSN